MLKLLLKQLISAWCRSAASIVLLLLFCRVVFNFDDCVWESERRRPLLLSSEAVWKCWEQRRSSAAAAGRKSFGDCYLGVPVHIKNSSQRHVAVAVGCVMPPEATRWRRCSLHFCFVVVFFLELHMI